MMKKPTAINTVFPLLAATLALILSLSCSSDRGALAYRTGYGKYVAGDYENAIRDFNKAIKIGFDDVHFAYHDRGLTKFALGDTLGAIDDYSKTYELDNEYFTALYSRGLARYVIGDYKGALHDFKRLTDWGFNFEQNEAQFSATIGGLYLFVGEIDSAMIWFKKVLKIEENDADMIAENKIVKDWFYNARNEELVDEVKSRISDMIAPAQFQIDLD